MPLRQRSTSVAQRPSSRDYFGGGACVLAVSAGYVRLLLRAPGGGRVPFGCARGQCLLVEVACVVRYADRYSDAWVERE